MNRSPELTWVARALRRRAWLVLLGALVGVGVAAVLALSPAQYTAQVQLLIGPPLTGNVDANSLERNVNSQISILQSRDVAERAAIRAGNGATAASVQSSTSFRELPGSDVVIVEATSEDEEASVRIANAYAAAYLEVTRGLADASVSPQLEQIDARLEELTAEIAVLNANLASAVEPYLARQNEVNPPPIPDPATLAPETVSAQRLALAEYERLVGEKVALQQEQRPETQGSVLQDATVTPGPGLRGLVTRTMAPVIAGTLLGALLALIIARASRRIATAAEVEDRLGVVTAVRLGYARRPKGSVAVGPHEPGEDERRLYAAVDRLGAGAGAKAAVVAVTPATEDHRTARVAWSLASQYARSGRATVLVDAEGYFDGAGLAPATPADRNEGSPVAPRYSLTDVDGLSLFRVGHRSRRWSRDSVEPILQGLVRDFAVVILALEVPLVSAATTQAWASSDVVVLTVPLDQVDTSVLEELRHTLDDVHGRLVPVVMKRAARGWGRSARKRVVFKREHDLEEPALATTASPPGAAMNGDVHSPGSPPVLRWPDQPGSVPSADPSPWTSKR